MSTINTNIPSLVAARVLHANSNRLSTSLERLSTGYRINSGKDDPAGLIASEGIRSDKIAIQAAIGNAQAADKVVSVAEGALNEVNALLLELESLVDRSANTAALSDEEIQANQLQVDAILSSIDRIASTTQFKGKQLLDGSLDYNTTGVSSSDLTSVNITSARLVGGTTRTVAVQVTSAAETGQLFHGPGAASLGAAATIRVTGEFGSDTVSLVDGTSLTDVAAAINSSRDLTGVSATVTGAGASSQLVFSSTNYGRNSFVTVEAISGTMATTNADSQTVDTDFGLDVTATVNGVEAVTNGRNVSVRSTTLSADLILSEDLATANGTTSTSFTILGGGANFSLSPVIGLAGMESLGIKSVASSSLGNSEVGILATLRSGGVNDLDGSDLSNAQRIVRAASEEVSTLRGRLGAFQKNTIQPTVNSLQITLENTSAAESAIRDTDFASETAELTRAQILVSTATATLQLANNAPASVLQLLG